MPNQPTKTINLPVPNDSLLARDVKVVRLLLPNAVMITLFSTPVEIVPAKTGYFAIPLMMVARKTNGAYTLNGSTKLYVKASVGAPVYISATASGFLDVAGRQSNISFGPSNGSVMLTEVTSTTVPTDHALQLTNDVANLSGAGGAVEVTLWYRRVRTAQMFATA